MEELRSFSIVTLKNVLHRNGTALSIVKAVIQLMTEADNDF